MSRSVKTNVAEMFFQFHTISLLSTIKAKFPKLVLQANWIIG